MLAHRAAQHATAASRHRAAGRSLALAVGLCVVVLAALGVAAEVALGSAAALEGPTGWLRAAVLAGCAGTAASAAVLFCAAGSTTAGALAAVTTAAAVVVEPSVAPPAAAALALVALACGASPAWTRREVAAGAERRGPVPTGAPTDAGVGRHARPRWNGQRVLPATLVLLVPLVLAVLWAHTGA